MNDHALNTMKRSEKGPTEPAPALDGPLAAVAESISDWPDVITTAHWDLYDPSRLDGIDFYVAESELGHIHLDGSLHLATSPKLGESLIAEKLARPFPYARGWVCEKVDTIGPDAAIALFRRNYEMLRRAS